MRMIRLATIAIARAFGLRAAGLFQDALFVLEQMLEQLLGMRIQLVNNLDESSIIAALTSQGELDTDRLLLVADLYKEQADIYHQVKDQKESSWRYLRALNFYIEVFLHGGPENLPAPGEKIEDLLQTLDWNQFPTETLFLLYYYSEDVGTYSRAENMLDRLEQHIGAQDEIRSERMAFYKRLLEKTDQELLQGGSSRQYIQTKIANHL
jgi:hypothetical protein